MSGARDAGNFLRAMAVASRERVRQARSQRTDAQLRTAALNTPPAPRLALSARGFDVIAEVKLRSPAAGQLKTGDENVAARVAGYAAAGACSVSVLTEPTRFDGELAHLEQAAAALAGTIPAMRKDFLVEPYQLYEARLAGAGGALVILRMLEHAAIDALLTSAAELGLFVLLEAFDEHDLALAAELAAARAGQLQLLVGVNCRDLTTLEVVPGRLEALVDSLPAGVPRVAESGVANAQEAARLSACGYDVALVGSALMRAHDPLALVRMMLEAGRAAAPERRCG